MSSTMLTLGQFDVAISDAGQKLHVASSVLVTPGDSMASHSFAHSTDPEDALTHVKPWIYSANRFLLILRVRCDDVYQEAMISRAVTLLAARLSNAHVWRQLGLLVEHLITASCEGQSAWECIVTLTHDDGIDRTARRCLHKLDRDVPHRDMRPPIFVPVWSLDSVQLEMKITERETHGRAVTKNGVQRRERESPQDSLFEASSRVDQTLDAGNEVEYFDNMDACDADDMALWDLNLFEEDCRDDGFSMALDLNPNGRVSTCAGDDLYSSPRYPAVLGPLEAYGPAGQLVLDDRQMLRALDYAILFAISGRAGKPEAVFKVKPTEDFNSLATIAPAVWSTGYLSAVSQRAVFLPTISSALTRVLYMHQHNRTTYSTTPSGLANPLPNAGTLQDRLACNLWNLLQNHKYTHAAQHLPPLCGSQVIGHVMNKGNVYASDPTASEYTLIVPAAEFTNDFDAEDLSNDEILDSRNCGSDGTCIESCPWSGLWSGRQIGVCSGHPSLE